MIWLVGSPRFCILGFNVIQLIGESICLKIQAVGLDKNVGDETE